MLSRLDYPSAHGTGERVLMLMLPAAGCQAAEFAIQGLVAAVQASAMPIDVAALQADLSLYLDGGIASAVHRQAVQPALAQGYRRIWLLGISLGGMGVLRYLAAHAAVVEGVILLAPFLGTRGTIASLARTGGIRGGSGSGVTTQTEQTHLDWLREFSARPCARPALYLGYGEEDRFAPGHRLLAELLPPARVVAIPGGHDWPCWRALFRRLLALEPFAT